VVQEEERRRRENEVFQHLRKKPGRERIDETLVQSVSQSSHCDMLHYILLANEMRISSVYYIS